MQLILSTFPGIDLLGRAFEAEGYCVVRSPDLIYGGDIRSFKAPRGVIDGVIGGPPCPDFSRAKRDAPTGYGLEMLEQFCRIVREARPLWFLMENVPGVPTIEIQDGGCYRVQRFNLNAKECGSRQNRLRCFQFGNLWNRPLFVDRVTDGAAASQSERCCLASEGLKKTRRGWPGRDGQATARHGGLSQAHGATATRPVTHQEATQPGASQADLPPYNLPGDFGNVAVMQS